MGLMHYLVVSCSAHGTTPEVPFHLILHVLLLGILHSHERRAVTLLVSMPHHRGAHCNLKAGAAFPCICYIPFTS
jgi:hypothetical protein